MILTIFFFFPATSSREARATSATPGRARRTGQEARVRTASLCFLSGGIMEPRLRGSCPPQGSGRCRQNTPSRPTWACPRAASTLISLTSEVITLAWKNYREVTLKHTLLLITLQYLHNYSNNFTYKRVEVQTAKKS